MPNTSCLFGPAFSISGESYFISNLVGFQVVFDSNIDYDSVLAYEWYLDNILAAGISGEEFSGKLSCGAHVVGARILTAEGWSGIKTFSFTTCNAIAELVLQGPDSIYEGSGGVYQVLQFFSDGSSVDISNQYVFTSSPSGSFSGNILQTVQDDTSFENLNLTISATGLDGSILTKQVTVINTTPGDVTNSSILVVDFFDNSSLDIIGFVFNTQVSNNYGAAYTGNNIIPGASMPANAYVLASDLNQNSSANWRFEFNLAKLIADFLMVVDFVFYIKGRGNVDAGINGAFSLKTNGATMILNGSPGTYMPSVVNGTTVGQIENFSSFVLPGANGSHNEADLNDVIRFNYNVPTDTLTYTVPTRSYSSQMISEEVQRNNCASGFEGSKVTYTLQAGAFTSSNNQADADNQARAYFGANKQQYANDNGTCTIIPAYHFKSSGSGNYPVTMTTGYSSGDCAMNTPFNGSLSNQAVIVDTTNGTTNLNGWGSGQRMFKVPSTGTYRLRAKLVGNIVCNNIGGDADHSQTIRFTLNRTGVGETDLIALNQNSIYGVGAGEFCSPGQYAIFKGNTVPFNIDFVTEVAMNANDEATFKLRINLMTHFNQQQGANETNTTNFNFSLLELEIEKI